MRRLLVPVAIAGLLLAAWWLLRPQAEEPAPHTEPAAASTPTTSTTPTTDPTTPATTPSEPTTDASADVELEDAREDLEPGESAGEPVAPGEVVVPRDERQAQELATYERAGAAFLEAFARPGGGITAEQWWAGVSPLLTEQAALDYAGVDPQTVPYTHVVASLGIVPTDAPAHLLTIARVQTDAGVYLVEMTTGPEGIRVARATPEAPQVGAP